MILDNMFYNYNYNHGHEKGQLKYVWGIGSFDVSKDLKSQFIANSGLDERDVYNLNLTAFNPILLDKIEHSSSESISD